MYTMAAVDLEAPQGVERDVIASTKPVGDPKHRFGNAKNRRKVACEINQNNRTTRMSGRQSAPDSNRRRANATLGAYTCPHNKTPRSEERNGEWLANLAGAIGRPQGSIWVGLTSQLSDSFREANPRSANTAAKSMSFFMP
jgi:hypothetical protein